MRYLVLARHGDYRNDQLSDYGRQQMSRMAERLKLILGDGKPLILSSTATRGWQSAEVLARGLGVSYERYDLLWSDNMHPMDLPAALELVRSRSDEADMVILVTHLEYTDQFPWYYADRTWSHELVYHGPDRGEALLIDCETITTQRLR
jgi:phosphohistidine phosphatase SixA